MGYYVILFLGQNCGRIFKIGYKFLFTNKVDFENSFSLELIIVLQRIWYLFSQHNVQKFHLVKILDYIKFDTQNIG